MVPGTLFLDKNLSGNLVPGTFYTCGMGVAQVPRQGALSQQIPYTPAPEKCRYTK
jgi:hypothetical protein